MGLWATAAQAGACKGCEPIKKTGQGFCDHCGAGKIYGVKMSSRKLYDALAGDAKALDKAKKSPCPGCKAAANKNGACEHCKIFVADGRVFHSATAQALARGKKIDVEKMKCAGCKYAAKSSGTCEGCNVRFVADRKYSSEGFHAAAKKAFATVKAAAKDAAHCEDCAVV